MDLHDVFLRYWGERKSYEYLSEFYAMKRKKDETVTRFNRRFHSFYLSMPKDIQPSEVVAMLFYNSSSSHLAFYLRERKPLTLQRMFIDAEEIEEQSLGLWKTSKSKMHMLVAYISEMILYAQLKTFIVMNIGMIFL
jgi:hypothetical protein